jgi:DNA-binding beta-propeller fold protein YncE
MRLLGISLLAMAASFAQGASLELVATIPMPNVRGRIDHFAVDVGGHRLFVAALGNDTVEVLDIAQNRHARSIAGFGEPQGLLYLEKTQRLYVGNGSSNRLDILDARTFAPAQRVDKLDDADNVRYDPAAGSVIVGYGTGALRVVDPESGASKGDIRLSGHPESFQVERGGGRIFVNVPAQRQVAVVDRAKGAVVGTWPVSARQNFPMALDEKGRRLFSGARYPAVVVVHDLDSGKEVAKLEIGDDTDDLFYDAERKRLYVICGEGRVDVFRQETPDRYVAEGSVKTAAKARTGLFVPEEGKLYVAAPASMTAPARVLVYAIR